MSRALRVLIGVVCVAVGIAGVLVARRSDAVTTYAALGTLELTAALAAAGALGAVACLLLGGRRAVRAGWAAAGAALAFSGPEWSGWENGPALVRTAGELAGPAPLLLCVGALVAGRRWFVPATAVLGTLVLARAAVRDPFTAADCWRNCSDNLLAVAPDVDAAALIRVLLHSATAVAALALGAICARRLFGSATGRSDRLAHAAVLVLAAVVAASSVLLASDAPDGPARSGAREMWIALCASLVLLSAALSAHPLALRRRRRRVRELARDLAAAPGSRSLTARLATDLGDPTLRVAFTDGAGGWLDEDGRPVAPPTASSRAVARIERSGRLIAAVECAPAALDALSLEEQLGAAARMALENGGLRARLAAQLEELTAVRRRIVEDGDATRRGLERALHDGAQQALVSLLIDLRIAAAEDPRAAEAAAEVQEALADLREVAHGIFPTVLAEDGVVAAVDVLLDDATMPVMDELEDVRLPPAVEVAAYRLFAQVLASQGEEATLRLRVEDGAVLAGAEIRGAVGGVELEEVEDRFAALQGHVVVQNGPGGSSVLGRVPLDRAAPGAGGWPS